MLIKCCHTILFKGLDGINHLILLSCNLCSDLIYCLIHLFYGCYDFVSEFLLSLRWSSQRFFQFLYFCVANWQDIFHSLLVFQRSFCTVNVVMLRVTMVHNSYSLDRSRLDMSHSRIDCISPLCLGHLCPIYCAISFNVTFSWRMSSNVAMVCVDVAGIRACILQQFEQMLHAQSRQRCVASASSLQNSQLSCGSAGTHHLLL